LRNRTDPDLIEEVDMTAEENKELIRRLFEHFRSHDTSAFDDLCHSDMLYETPEFGALEGLDAYRQAFGEATESIPDLKPVLEEMVAEGDRVFSIHRVRGTLQGDYAGIPPTNEPIDFLVSDVFTIRDGKVAAHREFYDVLTILRQIDAVDERPPSASDEARTSR
jgi:steroid delta-isomerase-like uncharacterized protein